MPRPPTPKDVREQILADWRTGEYSSRDLAHKHKVSLGFVSKLTKGAPKDLASAVNAGIEYRSAVLSESEHAVNAVNAIVDEKTRHLAFFRDATVKNVSLMMEKIGRKTSIDEHKAAQDTILKGRETVLGKSPETAIQINNQTPTVVIDTHDGD